MRLNIQKTKIIALFISFLFKGHSISAEVEFFKNKSQNDLSDKKFVELKRRVSSYLSNTWISQDKISLLMDLIATEKPDHCVEIGVFQGESYLPVAATLRHLKHGMVYAIDPWSNNEATKDLSDADANKKWWNELNMHVVYKNFSTTVDLWKLTNYTKVLRMTSEQAAPQINQIDFLHLDGNLSRVKSLQDVQLYLPKVKKGGYILYSNLFHNAENQHPKKEAFLLLFNNCEAICEVDEGNSVLFRKIQ